MKKMLTSALTMCMLLFAGLIHGQESRTLVKVDSPYRLLKGVVIKSDLRITATYPNQVVFVQLPEGAATPDYQTNHVLGWTGTKSVFLNLRQSIINPFQPNLNPSGFVVDGVLANDNSQRFNPVLFPPFGYFWQLD